MKGLLVLTALVVLETAGHASIIVYDASLNGASEAPPTASAGTGFAIVTIDTILNTMTVNVVFSGLTTGTTASHIHCCTTTPLTGSAGVATTTPTFPSFPLGVTSGTYNMLFDLTNAASYNPAFVTANGGTTASAESTLLAGMAAGEAYLNIHTTTYPGGEISGFLVPSPEPASFVMAGLALGGLCISRRRLRSGPARG